jgi:hypothetical protein
MYSILFLHLIVTIRFSMMIRGRRGRDRMVVAFITICAISAYHLITCDRYVVFSTNKNDHHDITEILLKVALNTITLTLSMIIIIHISPLYCQIFRDNHNSYQPPSLQMSSPFKYFQLIRHYIFTFLDRLPGTVFIYLKNNANL